MANVTKKSRSLFGRCFFLPPKRRVQATIGLFSAWFSSQVSDQRVKDWFPVNQVVENIYSSSSFRTICSFVLFVCKYVLLDLYMFHSFPIFPHSYSILQLLHNTIYIYIYAFKSCIVTKKMPHDFHHRYLNSMALTCFTQEELHDLCEASEQRAHCEQARLGPKAIDDGGLVW